ncbi:iron(III) transport system ATP-binding protein/putative spermidine/putrescine transport system ATP-binding protein [Blastococcus colisei]|uniref:Iron(III) transport system ATP-binding protein/putative spermidine/putrescine transport system ATP-binding protein n=1 Tax=Blastococcus colisei TaxID=1564162 RepID=A0A543PET7_9ACTN|nr:ABC transporter ATP-binding protein [Blastococcus colisei]TQN42583.1 iron(III) transport system ATP-binding protein/putative spermidine/putrescine transport system ATP-binding protein [Blastococcus colisei]
MPAEPVLEVTDLVVEYDGTTALAGVTLEVRSGEVLALLGPSGSGKSTLLHTVAGFLLPRSGTVRLAGTTVAGDGRPVAPERRDLAVVFQNYALWPHLSALDTVAYPARRRGTGRKQARAEALAILDRLRIAHLADRKPAELSGGEQQRVGLARALARRASVYLFDEPTAHLDTHVRGVFLEELVARQRDSGAAAVYATHDAEEALGLADRVALLREGRLLQVGTPQQIYGEPVDLFAARLTGPASVVDAPDGSAKLLVRPGWARLGGDVDGDLRAVWFRGPHSDYLVDSPLGELLIREPGAPRHPVGARVGWTLERSWPIG